MIYLDNAATSYPKPPEVIKAIEKAFYDYGANPGRSGHDMSVRTADAVYRTREKINALFNGPGAERVVFTQNCTSSLNMAIKGCITHGAHVLISSLEHNSVVRPLETLMQRGEITYTAVNATGGDDEIVDRFASSFTPKTTVVICTHASNVSGRIMPVKRIAEITKKHGALMILDAAQSAGILDIDFTGWQLDCLCAPGHKGLMGPMGTGVLLCTDCIKRTVIEGGTGSSSFNLLQPSELPDMLESGTLNVPGIIALGSGVDYVTRAGVSNIFAHEYALMSSLREAFSPVEEVIPITSDGNVNPYVPIYSFNIRDMHSEQVAQALSERGIAVRAGFHCAPLAHMTYKTEHTGAVRCAPSVFTEKKDIKTLIKCVIEIAKSK